MANHHSLNINLYPLTKFNLINGINFKIIDEKPGVMPSLISRIPEWKVIKYFKENPTLIYMLHNCPDLKKKIMDKANINDYSRIGRALKNGLI